MTDHPGLSNGRNSIEKCYRHAAAIETLLATARALAASSEFSVDSGTDHDPGKPAVESESLVTPAQRGEKRRTGIHSATIGSG